MHSAAWSFARLPKTYFGLVALHMPRPIHDEAVSDNAVEVVRTLAGHKLNHDPGHRGSEIPAGGK